MFYKKTDVSNTFGKYQAHYKDINGGIDGYYENTILDGDIYEVIDGIPIACFSIHKDRGLTSLIVYPRYKNKYKAIFSYVLDLPLFHNILFTENDKEFMNCIHEQNIDYEIQSYNFNVSNKVVSSMVMNQVSEIHHHEIIDTFGAFIRYNNINLNTTKTFIYKENNELISFGAVEPLRLKEKRYCVSMIVHEKYRNKGYGVETVKYLINYLHSNGYEVNARCYVKNDVSKKTLLRSGMKISNRLFKVEINQ